MATHTRTLYRGTGPAFLSRHNSPGGFSASTARNSSAVNFTSIAAMLSFNCSRVRGPMIGQVTPGTCKHHATEKLAAADPMPVGQLVNALHQRPLAGWEIRLILRLIPSAVGDLSPPARIRPRQSALCQRRPGRIVAISYFRQNGKNLRLNPPIDDVQLRLLDIEPRRPHFPGQEMRLRQLPSRKNAARQVQHLALPHQVIQRPQRLIDWGIGVGPMNCG